MSDSERISELKKAPMYPANIEDFGIVKIYKEDFNWLIEQAEKLEELKEQTLYSDFINQINELEKEIKCLKEERKENHGEQQHETHPVLDRGAL